MHASRRISRMKGRKWTGNETSEWGPSELMSWSNCERICKQERDLMGQKERSTELEGWTNCMSEKEMEIWWDWVRGRHRVRQPRGISASLCPSACLLTAVRALCDRGILPDASERAWRGEQRREDSSRGLICRWMEGDGNRKWIALSLLRRRGDTGKDLRNGGGF